MTFLERVESYVGAYAFDAVEVWNLQAVPESAEGANDGVSAEEVADQKYKQAISRFLKEGVVDVVEKTLVLNSGDLHLFCQNLIIRPMDTWESEQNIAFKDYFIPFKDADGGYHIKNNHIQWVGREFGAITVPCHEITPEKALRIQDPESIYFTGVDYRNPVFYRSASKIYIFPETSAVDEGKASVLLYDDSLSYDKDIIKYFPEHLYHLVAMYASIRALKIASSQKRREYEKYNTPMKVWKELYPNEVTPIVPDFPADAPGFTDNEFNLDYSFGDEASNMSQLFSNVWNRIQIEEDVELVSSEIGRFNAMVSEYQNNLASLTTRQQNILTEFTAKLSDFNSKWDTMLKIWTQKVQSYTTEMQLLKSDITDLQNQYNQSFYPKSVEEEKDKQE
jgi:hypothetical protein